MGSFEASANNRKIKFDHVNFGLCFLNSDVNLSLNLVFILNSDVNSSFCFGLFSFLNNLCFGWDSERTAMNACVKEKRTCAAIGILKPYFSPF